MSSWRAERTSLRSGLGSAALQALRGSRDGPPFRQGRWRQGRRPLHSETGPFLGGPAGRGWAKCRRAVRRPLRARDAGNAARRTGTQNPVSNAPVSLEGLSAPVMSTGHCLRRGRMTGAMPFVARIEGGAGAVRRLPAHRPTVLVTPTTVDWSRAGARWRSRPVHPFGPYRTYIPRVLVSGSAGKGTSPSSTRYPSR